MGLERKHVISASIVGFVSWLLITAAVPSLRWVPYAFVAGALATFGGLGFLVVTTAWSHHDATHHAPPRAVPAFITNARWEREKAALNARSVYIKNSLFSQSPTVSTRIDRLLGLVLRDFVTSWYKNISGRPLFQNEVERAIRDAMASIRDRLSGLDMVEVALTKFVPIITNHLQEFYTAERLVRGKNLTRDITESEELDLAIAGKYKDGKLHKAASLAFSDTKLMQQGPRQSAYWQGPATSPVGRDAVEPSGHRTRQGDCRLRRSGTDASHAGRRRYVESDDRELWPCSSARPKVGQETSSGTGRTRTGVAQGCKADRNTQAQTPRQREAVREIHPSDQTYGDTLGCAPFQV